MVTEQHKCLIEEKLISIIRKLFQEQEKHTLNKISGNFEFSMREVNSLKNEIRIYKKLRVHRGSPWKMNENINHLTERAEEIYKYVLRKLTELEDRFRRNNLLVDGIT